MKNNFGADFFFIPTVDQAIRYKKPGGWVKEFKVGGRDIKWDLSRSGNDSAARCAWLAYNIYKCILLTRQQHSFVG